MHGLRRQGTHKSKSACYQKLMSMKEKFGSCANMGREQIEENLKIKGNERFRKMAAGRVLVLHKGSRAGTRVSLAAAPAPVDRWKPRRHPCLAGSRAGTGGKV
ncbi:uncharacterized protein LOC119288112 isoform X2 [Triticum dicoccoides]|uniref:uncharacterized protein LOC119288112 isoform X2 n=1 Tax=Triticum dicoccoides TaxID=85692 RepID=UPI00188E72D5|nr:uncharacterized protein LOC119288112 isoform X2 [Triticum dicoccoides]XP_044424257.1 uncharacterized protein LOC123148803 isoform X3 [Triticum aestivum]XP_044424262.1 uncharacterized protein LOC123148803 isoform X3 [Triticum aestivum]XP_044424264.1 uncharacterized protein LOC123148803 isoform X3 [Triticum aestivum]